MLEYYLKATHPENQRLFQLEVKISKKFDIHTTTETVWFQNVPVGKTMIPKMLPLLCQAAGVDELTNHSLRATAINALARSGFQFLEIAQGVSHHKNLNNLASYNRPTEVLKTRMGVSIQHGE